MHDKLKTFKAYKSNRRLICCFIWEQGFWEQRTKTEEGKEKSLLFVPKILTPQKTNYNDRTPDTNR